MFSPEEQRMLFRIARGVVRAAFHDEPFEFPTDLPESLTRPSGVFVTLELDGELRGCIGTVMPVDPLFLAVGQNALNAAFRDPRFPTLTPQEFERVHFEISVMSVPEPVLDFERITVGQDGLIVRKGRFAGLLLPQVATDYGWTREEFLRQTCVKAGLPGDAWKRPGLQAEKFTAVVLTEVTENA